MPLPCMYQYELKQVISTLWHHIFLPMEWELDGTTSKAWKALQLMGKAKQKKKKTKKGKKKRERDKEREEPLDLCLASYSLHTFNNTHPLLRPKPW